MDGKREDDRMDTKRTAREIVREAAVLLKNEDRTLPFAQGQKAAFFGRSQLRTYVSGNGSGAAKGAKTRNILLACEEAGIGVYPALKAYYQAKLEAEAARPDEELDFARMKDLIHSGLMYEVFGKYHTPAKEYEIPEILLSHSRDFTDTAVLVLGRDAGGEECDRHLEDFELTPSEQKLVKGVCETFECVVLILNTNGLTDLSWLRRYPSVKSILFLGIPGEEGAKALAEILTGQVNPSGKLSVTVAESFEDYPSSKHFSWDKDCPDRLLTYESYGLDARENGSVGFDKSLVTVYWEDIYAGYRYFDTFHKKVLFPFGFGLSYTEFDIRAQGMKKDEKGVRVLVQIKNTGDRAGKEVVQMYLSAPGSALERPFQELKGFEKTKLLNPGETETFSILLPWEEMAVYVEETAVYQIQKGTYLIRIGSSSRDTRVSGAILAQEDILIRTCENRLGLRSCNRGKLKFLSSRDEGQLQEQETVKEGYPCLQIYPGDVRAGEKSSQGKKDLWRAGKPDPKSLSDRELAALCVGYGPGTPFSAFGDGTDPETIFDEAGKPLTTNSHPTGTNGYVSPAMEEKGIFSVHYKDGPAGTGMTAWPSEMLLACAFNREIWRSFGDCVGQECQDGQVNVWLAPAVNLHRNPLGGRNFEYFSEDPYLTGVCACQVAMGVQEEHPVIVCPKHFAMNEQETFRRGSAKKNYDAADSILTERAARELYLKPFEMLVRNAHITCIMTSFNKINGIFAGGNKDLCTHILREEWGFEGAVVTDWGDMDTVVDGADAAAAGNDIVMPGGPPVIAQILKGLAEGRVTRGQLEEAVGHLFQMLGSAGK